MKSKILLTGILAFFLSGCMKNVLDRTPLNLITDADVWKSDDLAAIYLTTLYDNLPFGFYTTSKSPQLRFTSYETDESAWNNGNPVDSYGSDPNYLNTTAYQWIRNCNYFLANVETGNLPDKDELAGQCRFLRAYYYFDLVRKYGGMPIINQVQSFTGSNLAELQVPRNTEDSLYEYIGHQLDSAASELPASWDAANANRATKWAALALKSRAMLYAGSIAKYNPVQLNGLVGIPAGKANAYYNKSMEASKEIMDGGQFALYTKYYDPNAKTGNPSVNYQNIFLDKNNKEIIFQKAYSYPSKGHSYDVLNLPQGYTDDYGGYIDPFLEMVESYEYVDGSPGKLKINDAAGNPIEYPDPNAIFANKDPRFDASIFHGGDFAWGRVIQMWAGIYDLNGNLFNTATPFPPDPSTLGNGLDGPGVSDEGAYSKTGFDVKKYMDTATLITTNGGSDVNYIDFRYAEILLNYAEAAFETSSDLPGALDAINQIRNRAGIRVLMPSELTVDRIRNERKVELAFEDKRMWDIRRWNIGPKLFNNTYMQGLWPYLKYKGNGKYTYIYKINTGDPIDWGFSRIWTEADNYSELSDYIATNPNIVQNPGW